MELKKQITISEVEEKIKELRKIENLIGSKIKIVIEKHSQIANIDEGCNEELVEIVQKSLNEKRIKILEELQEYGLIEHSIEPFAK